MASTKGTDVCTHASQNAVSGLRCMPSTEEWATAAMHLNMQEEQPSIHPARHPDTGGPCAVPERAAKVRQQRALCIVCSRGR